VKTTYPDAVESAAVTPARGISRTVLVYAALFLTCVALSWGTGMFRSEFGRYQDEGMHYMTGLFAQDFLTSGHWSNPMSFARQYYLHYPKIAPGQWPPLFPVMQVVWALIFGVSRASMIFGMIGLTAWFATVVYAAGARYFGRLMGAIGAILLIAAPLTQEQTAMVMAEIPLAAASLLAISAFSRFLESARRRDALAFALWTFAAIMIKGNGWVVVLAAPAILLLSGRFRLLRNPWLWLSGVLIALLCVPYTLMTMHIVTQGWDTTSFPGFAYEWASLEMHLGYVARLLGIPLAVVACFGAAMALFRRSSRPWAERDPYWLSIIVYGITVILFHVAVPSSIEPRKIYQITPVMCLLVLAGVNALAALLTKDAGSPRSLRPALAAAALLVFAFTGFSPLPGYAPGFEPAVANLIARPESRGAAILISSSPQWSDGEAALIAEWASRARNDGTYLIRGSKLLSHTIPAAPGESEFAANFSSPNEILQTLASIPISFVILHDTEARNHYPHQAMLKAALDNDPADWEPVYHSERRLSSLGQTHTIEIYRCRKNLAGVPIHYSIDLTRKLGSEITTGP
jgi:Dolichyl-phosphate-mannose-protein mannosyltransferase